MGEQYQVTMTLGKLTKNFAVYTSEEQYIPTLYIHKSKFGSGMPKQIVVTVEAKPE